MVLRPGEAVCKFLITLAQDFLAFVLCGSTLDAVVNAFPHIAVYFGTAASFLSSRVAAVMMLAAPVNGITWLSMATQATITAIVYVGHR